MRMDTTWLFGLNKSQQEHEMISDKDFNEILSFEIEHQGSRLDLYKAEREALITSLSSANAAVNSAVAEVSRIQRELSACEAALRVMEGEVVETLNGAIFRRD